MSSGRCLKGRRRCSPGCRRRGRTRGRVRRRPDPAHAAGRPGRGGQDQRRLLAARAIEHLRGSCTDRLGPVDHRSAAVHHGPPARVIIRLKRRVSEGGDSRGRRWSASGHRHFPCWSKRLTGFNPIRHHQWKRPYPMVVVDVPRPVVVSGGSGHRDTRLKRRTCDVGHTKRISRLVNDGVQPVGI